MRFQLLALAISSIARAELDIREVGESSSPDSIEFRGIAAGRFDPKLWEAGKLNLVRDIHWPLLEPRDGKFRNIYAPSVVKTPQGWTIFFGGWDGVPTGNDRIYRTDTADFLTFVNRQLVIDHGDCQHICNVSAIRREGAFEMLCTVLPEPKALNKPAFFRLPDSPNPRFITMTGYDHFADADINGMNVLLREDNKYRLYFGNFRDGGKTFRASSDDAVHFTFDGIALEPSAFVNDVKRFDVTGQSHYLMALHRNTDRLFYSTSRDGLHFDEMRPLASAAGEADRHIVAVGWVCDGERLLGFLYGAGASPSLAENRIFARWLQKKVSLDTEAEAHALGPDRQIIRATKPYTGRVRLLREDGETELAAAGNITLKSGRAYVVTARDR
jgi:hypothetical protein